MNGNWKKWILPALCFAILVEGSFRAAARLQTPPTDSFFFLMAGARISHGQVPYRDFFYLQFPGFPWLYAGVFQSAPWNRIILHGFITFLILALGTLFVAALWRKKGVFAALAGALFFAAVCADDFYQLYRIPALSILMLLTIIPHEKWRCAGFLCGLATLFDQALGIAATLLFAFYIARKRRLGPLLEFGISAAVPLILMLAILSFQNALRPWWSCTVDFAVRRYGIANFNPESALWHATHFPRLGILTLWSTALVFPALRDVWRSNDSRAAWAVFLLGALYASVVKSSFLTGIDGTYLLCGGYTLVLLQGVNRHIAAAVACLALWLFVIATFVGSRSLPEESELQRWAAKHSNEKLVFYIWRSEAYFSARQVSPLYLEALESRGFHTPEQLQRVINGLHRHQPDFIAWDSQTSAWESDAPAERTSLAPLYRWIRENYRRTDTLESKVEIYESGRRQPQ